MCTEKKPNALPQKISQALGSGALLFLANTNALAALPDISPELGEFETWMEGTIFMALVGLGVVALGAYVIPTVFKYARRSF